jgi:hypothetical protein
MRRALVSWGGALALLCGGCMSGPLLDNPSHIAAAPSSASAGSNPVYVPLGPDAYNLVFEKVYDIISEYFEVSFSNRFGGQIETFPRIAPGLEQPWKPGSPDFHQRLLATFQTIRHRAVVLIQPANDGGYFVDVKVFKELEDLARPTRATAGAAAFRSDNTLQRQFEVIDANVVSFNWIPLGRDVKLEQVLLRRIASFDLRELREACEKAAQQPPPPPQP